MSEGDKLNEGHQIEFLNNSDIPDVVRKDVLINKPIVKYSKETGMITISIDKDKIQELENIEQLIELASKENDLAVIKDCEKKITQLLNQIKKTEVSCFLSEENDHLDTYLEVHAGAGGTESQDWAEMLRRMYSKWV